MPEKLTPERIIEEIKHDQGLWHFREGQPREWHDLIRLYGEQEWRLGVRQTTAHTSQIEIRRAALEEACKTLCGYCDDGLKAYKAKGEWKHAEHPVGRCSAQTIRALMEKDRG